jgi:hypothetical protein
MGSPNRELTDSGWKLLANTPRMPRDIYQLNGKPYFYSSHNPEAKIPLSDSTPLYYLFLGLHDGKLIYGQWVWLNDASVLAGLVLFVTGFIKWRRKRVVRSKS